jgi:hypothetical protein
MAPVLESGISMLSAVNEAHIFEELDGTHLLNLMRLGLLLRQQLTTWVERFCPNLAYLDTRPKFPQCDHDH